MNRGCNTEGKHLVLRNIEVHAVTAPSFNFTQLPNFNFMFAESAHEGVKGHGFPRAPIKLKHKESLCVKTDLKFGSFLLSPCCRMNLFRLSGDLSHLIAILILLVKMWRTRSVAGKMSWIVVTGH